MTQHTSLKLASSVLGDHLQWARHLSSKGIVTRSLIVFVGPIHDGCQSIRTHVKSYHANSYPSQLVPITNSYLCHVVPNTKSYPSHLVPYTNSYPTRTKVTTNSYPTTNLPTCGLSLTYKLKSTYPT